MDIEQFISDHVGVIEPLETQCRQAWWNLATSGDLAFAKQFEQLSIQIRKIYSSQIEYQLLKEVPMDSLDHMLQRQVQLLLHRYAEHQIPAHMIEEIANLETQVEAIYTNFRAIVDGKTLSNNDLKEIFVSSNDSAQRQRAWVASKEIGTQVENLVVRLVSLRNEAAQKAGFSNYYSMRLELQELDEKHLFTLLDELDALTRPLWDAYKKQLDLSLSSRFNVPTQELMPWHYQDPFFQEAPSQDIDFDQYYQNKDLVEISRSVFRTVGMPVDDVLERSDLWERPQKNQHAFCTCIDQKQDVRILCNLRNTEYWMSTLLHELGHAVYDKYIHQDLPYLLRLPAHTSTTEAIAMFFGRWGTEKDFLEKYCGVNLEKTGDIVLSNTYQTAIQLLVFARWTLVMVHFERALYQEVGKDRNTLWWDYVERFQCIKRMPGRNKPDWAAKLHLACAPVYYQNYILGEMTASQLKHAVKASVEKYSGQLVESPSVGMFFKTHLFRLGALHPWNTTLQKVTGELLNPEYFVRDISV
jgi:peptidyl-dipeptidase A